MAKSKKSLSNSKSAVAARKRRTAIKKAERAERLAERRLGKELGLQFGDVILVKWDDAEPSQILVTELGPFQVSGCEYPIKFTKPYTLDKWRHSRPNVMDMGCVPYSYVLKTIKHVTTLA